MTNKKKTWKYHTSHSFVIVDGEVKIQMLTQLYQIGVYGIINGRSELQRSYVPKDLVAIEKVLQKDLENGEIKDLEFGRPITVTTDDDGFFVEVVEQP